MPGRLHNWVQATVTAVDTTLASLAGSVAHLPGGEVSPSRTSQDLTDIRKSSSVDWKPVASQALSEICARTALLEASLSTTSVRQPRNEQGMLAKLTSVTS